MIGAHRADTTKVNAGLVLVFAVANPAKFGFAGTIEAVSVQGAAGFALAVQWHPEWRVLDNPVSRRLFAAFGAACRARACWLCESRSPAALRCTA